MGNYIMFWNGGIAIFSSSSLPGLHLVPQLLKWPFQSSDFSFRFDFIPSFYVACHVSCYISEELSKMNKHLWIYLIYPFHLISIRLGSLTSSSCGMTQQDSHATMLFSDFSFQFIYFFPWHMLTIKHVTFLLYQQIIGLSSTSNHMAPPPSCIWT